MQKQVAIAVDMMSGDSGADTSCRAVSDAISRGDACQFILVGRRTEIVQHLKKYPCRLDHVKIVDCDDVVRMTDNPLLALRKGRRTSMWIALDLVKQGVAHACVSAGNTGVLMAMSRYLLKMKDGIQKPAICTYLPIEDDKEVLALDLGANVDCQPNHLLEFAKMGSDLHVKESPTVGLLANGTESIKGNQLVKSAHDLLASTASLNYIGYVEGDQLFKGVADVIVCDGFVGNLVLKSCEGLTRMLTNEIANVSRNSWYGVMVKSLLKKALSRFDPQNRGAAILLGLKASVIKVHGAACHRVFLNGISEALKNARHHGDQHVTTPDSCYAE